MNHLSEKQLRQYAFDVGLELHVWSSAAVLRYYAFIPAQGMGVDYVASGIQEAIAYLEGFRAGVAREITNPSMAPKQEEEGNA